MAATVPIKLLIVDDSELRCIGIQSYLENEQDIDVVATCHTLSEAVLLANQLNPWVVLLSVSLPDTHTFEACQAIAANDPSARIIALGSSPLNPGEFADSMMAGATGFLPEDSRVSDFVRVIRANGVGELLFTATVAEIVHRTSKIYVRRVDPGSFSFQGLAKPRMAKAWPGAQPMRRIAAAMLVSPPLRSSPKTTLRNAAIT